MLNIIQGLIIGVANVIPGVSGGTLALIMGIYEKLMEAIGTFFKVDRKQKLSFAFFLFKIFIGAVLGILLFARMIDYLYTNHFQPTNFFFIGLILSSVPGIIKGEEKITAKKRNLIFFFIGFLIIILLSKIHSVNAEAGLISEVTPMYSIKLLLCGAMASAAMIIPGISGSMLLMILGEYYNILGFINNRNLLAILIVGIGVILGILLFSKLVDYLLKKHRPTTLYFIVGLILASIIEIWPGINLDPLSVVSNMFSFFMGAFLVVLMFKIEKRGKRVV